MNLGWVRPFLIRSKHWMVKNAPHILMAMGTGGSITAVIFAAQAKPKADQLLKDAKREKNTREDTDIYVEELTKLEKVKTVLPAYLPAAGMEFFSLLCFWGAHGIDVRRQAVRAGLYSTAEQALIEYQKKVVEMIGDKPEREIRSAVAQDQLDRDPPPTMLLEPDTDVWCMYKGYQFRNNDRTLNDSQNDANYELINHLYLSESDLLWMFDPERRYVVPSQESRMIGWSVDRLMEFDILPCMTPTHQPALKVEIRDKDGREYLPKPGYSASL
ncbi:MAG: hypothetical protein J6Y48_16795 [Clostridia bacterium]|nr:hypothetical protein [Clostridia bacterium]